MTIIRPPRFLLWPARLLLTVLVAVAATIYIPLRSGTLPLAVLWGLVPLFLLGNLLPYLFWRCIPAWGSGRRGLLSGHSRHTLRACAHGVEMLRIFLLSTAVAILYHLVRLPLLWQGRFADWLISAGIAVAVEAAVFWNGMLCLYSCSVQLGIRRRVMGALCGLIPVVQLVVLSRIMRAVSREVEDECARIARNLARRDDGICATRYPILLVHGVFFRDYKRLNYWGRIPDELTYNGATVYHGQQQSALAVADSARELAARIQAIVEENGCEKVNIIAHSKGGLDIRWALAFEDVAPMVASVTTINTPHHGCQFADFLLGTAPVSFRNQVATTYNAAAHALGDKNPDFLAAVGDLTAARCGEMNRALEGEEDRLAGILCQSVHSRLDRASGGQFPLNCSYLIAKWFDGPNDGLVSEASARWGETHTLLTPTGKRGISHGDMIDLNRQNLEGFDVREYYVELVADLNSRGL